MAKLGTMSPAVEGDLEYEEIVIASVEAGKGGWELRRQDGWMFWCPDAGIEPHAGDVARFYGRGVGSLVRGLAINGQVVFYRTEKQQQQAAARAARARDLQKQQDYQQHEAEYAAKIAALPPVFQRRIARFRRTNPEFNWQFLSYELLCCIDAVNIAATCQTPEAIAVFAKLRWDKQKARIPNLFDGHSGNSFDFACRLASEYVTDERYIPLEHGALAILVGCGEYGCEPGAGLEAEDREFYTSLQTMGTEE